MEERKEVKTIKVDYLCPKCGKGYLRPTGQVFTTNPPQYPHRCNNPECDYGETFMGIAYPYFDYEPVLKFPWGQEVPLGNK
jgi:hypothetical protein